jgi:heme/copper-type cytochrome/quinol oxidase subunit 3
MSHDALLTAGRQSAIDPTRLGMLIFLASETMLFGGFIAAFLVFRLGAPVWPPPLQPRLPVEVTAGNSAVLLLSGITMGRALRASREGNSEALVASLIHTALLGMLFLGVQGYEWTRLLTFGLTASSGVYGGTFYTLIGAHALHLLGALTWLCIFLGRVARGLSGSRAPTALPVFAMYWYFVVALWPVLYCLVYLG